MTASAGRPLAKLRRIYGDCSRWRYHGSMFSRHMKPYKKALARRMRANPTPAERELWKHLRQSGLKFRRQACCAGYILDFYCPSRRLAVEVDGPCHRQKESADWARDGHLLRYGISTMRFSNEEVLRDPASVVAKIQAKADSSRDFRSWNAGLRYRKRAIAGRS